MVGKVTLYPERGSKTLEFKEKLPNFATLIKTCVAFANTAGGQIIIGVEDKTCKIIGVSDSDRERLYESFPNSLYDATNNGLFVHVYERNFNHLSVLVIEVPLSSRRPCFVKKEGIPKGVYLRVGTSNRRAQHEHVEELMRESKHQYFDSEATKIAFDKLSKERLIQCYGESYSHQKLEADGVIIKSNFSPEQYMATIAGVLMFYDAPEDFIPEAVIRCTEFSGVSGRKVVQIRDLKGPIPELISDCTRLLEHWLQRHFVLQGARLVGEMPVPMAALREAITNGLLHRKYTVPGALKVALYDDRLEILSPGGFPGVVDIKNFESGISYLRNLHLVKIARRLNLIEKPGAGIKLIFEACQKQGIKKPTYHEGGDFVKGIFYFAPSVAAEDTDEEAVLKFMTMRQTATISDVTQLLDVSRNTATRKLSHLIKQKKIVRKGAGPSVRYYLK